MTKTPGSALSLLCWQRMETSFLCTRAPRTTALPSTGNKTTLSTAASPSGRYTQNRASAGWRCKHRRVHTHRRANTSATPAMQAVRGGGGACRANYGTAFRQAQSHNPALEAFANIILQLGKKLQIATGLFLHNNAGAAPSMHGPTL